ncbi:hypothetical protein IMCC1989_927 [gamma proteobacterium IMCC1989]|nr:hypothetical protein IMCC1989_927 [gamma proteobacterium IMCC1989]
MNNMCSIHLQAGLMPDEHGSVFEVFLLKLCIFHPQSTFFILKVPLFILKAPLFSHILMDSL